MKKLPTIKNTDGLSLVEVIIAVFLIGAIALVIANIPNAINLVTGSQSESRAREVAAGVLEDARFSGYDNLANGTTAINNSKLNSLTNMAGAVTISDCPPEICTQSEQVKKVSVLISWTENQEPKNITVVTLVSKGGLK